MCWADIRTSCTASCLHIVPKRLSSLINLAYAYISKEFVKCSACESSLIFSSQSIPIYKEAIAAGAKNAKAQYMSFKRDMWLDLVMQVAHGGPR